MFINFQGNAPSSSFKVMHKPTSYIYILMMWRFKLLGKRCGIREGNGEKWLLDELRKC
jgi:hypothetical protein